jgi:hypothetical protein
MKKDKFDELLKDKTVRIIMTVESVESLWATRSSLTPRQKRRRFPELFESLHEVATKLHTGYVYDRNEMMHSKYFGYLRGYHRSWLLDPLSPIQERQITNKFNDVVALLHSVKDIGVQSPLDMVIHNGQRKIFRGVRRLVIMKVLDLQLARVRNAIVNSYSSTQ